MSSKQKFVQLSPTASASTSTGNIFEYTDRKNSRTDPYTKRVGGIEIVPWGKDNLQPYHDRQLLADNDIKLSIIEKKVNLLTGSRMVLYTETTDENGKYVKNFVKDPQLEDWIEEWNLENFFEETLLDTEEFGQSFAEIILSRNGRKVTSLESMNLVDCRLTPALNRRDSETLAVADWLKDKGRLLSADEIEMIPLLNCRRPQNDIGKYFKSALHIKKHISGQPYYNQQIWSGTKSWTEVANVIPKFHLQGLKNGYMLRYHIKIPVSYFSKFGTEEKIEAEKTRLQEQLDKVLSGEDNAHKSFMSFITRLGTNTEEWKIEKIETDLKDESYLKLHENASKVHARGHGIHPVLAGIETSGALSSGSEILNLLNFFTKYVAPSPRRLALSPINLVKNYNFPNKRDIKIGIQDSEFTTTDKNPTGTQNTTT